MPFNSNKFTEYIQSVVFYRHLHLSSSGNSSGNLVFSALTILSSFVRETLSYPFSRREIVTCDSPTLSASSLWDNPFSTLISFILRPIQALIFSSLPGRGLKTEPGLIKSVPLKWIGISQSEKVVKKIISIPNIFQVGLERW